ncbi:DUF4376 domain-containing protein [Panacagrimonas sp.]|uniref:DUF4376 domain-containing protein n=1 Tax=Panacagrimonas sp. TaxID=2480088 RepID=UPI003B51D450
MIRIRSSGAVVSPREFRLMHEPIIIPPVVSQADAEMFGADVIAPTPSPDPGLFAVVESGEPEQIEGIWTQTWTITPILVEQARAILHEQVAAERLRLERLGVPYVFPVDVAGTIQTRDDTDTRNIQGVVTTAMILQAQGVTDPVLEFRTADNVNHALTPSQAIAMGMAVSAHVNALYSAKWTHDAAIEQLADTVACAAYDTTTGWPE